MVLVPLFKCPADIWTHQGTGHIVPKDVTTFEKIEISTIIALIRDGKWKEQVDKCKIDIQQKLLLDWFSPTGISHLHLEGSDQEYNGIICLDIDNIDDMIRAQKITRDIPWVYASFVTPSGRGLKVLVRTNSSRDSYTITEESVAFAYKECTGLVRHYQCRNIDRYQYVSYDPGAYYNENSEIFVNNN